VKEFRSPIGCADQWTRQPCLAFDRWHALSGAVSERDGRQRCAGCVHRTGPAADERAGFRPLWRRLYPKCSLTTSLSPAAGRLAARVTLASGSFRESPSMPRVELAVAVKFDPGAGAAGHSSRGRGAGQSNPDTSYSRRRRSALSAFRAAYETGAQRSSVPQAAALPAKEPFLRAIH
jgi:hypothetical protein